MLLETLSAIHSGSTPFLFIGGALTGDLKTFAGVLALIIIGKLVLPEVPDPHENRELTEYDYTL